MNFHQPDPDRSEIAARPQVVISYEGSGKFVGLYEPLPDGRMMLTASHNAIEGPERLVMGLAAEIERLRELIRRALADGMGVLDEPDYDLYGELSTYLGDMQ